MRPGTVGQASDDVEDEPREVRAPRVLVSGWRLATVANHGNDVEKAMRVACDVINVRPRAAYGVVPVLVHGDCSGVDRIARDIARSWGWHIEGHPAINHPHVDFGGWPQAGPRRNLHMVRRGAAVMAALPGATSKGTWHCVMTAGAAGIRAIVWPLGGGRIEEG